MKTRKVASKKLHKKYLSAKQLEFLEDGYEENDSIMRKNARKMALKFQLLGIIEELDLPCVAELCRKCAMPRSRVSDKNKPSYKHFNFENVFDMVFQILVNNDKNNGFYTLFKHLFKNNLTNEVIEIHKTSEDTYELGGIYPLFKKSHDWQHDEGIRIIKWNYTTINGEIAHLVDRYDSKIEFMKEYQVTVDTLKKALFDEMINIDGETYQIKTIKHGLIMSFEQHLYYLEEQNKINPKDVEVKEDMELLKILIEEDKKHNQSMHNFKFIKDITQYWNSTALKLAH